MYPQCTFDIDAAINARGQVHKGFVEVSRKADGALVYFPVVVVSGAKEGKTLLVDGGHHGYEFEGTEALIEISHELDPQKIKGTLIIVPCLNVDAFASFERVSFIDRSFNDQNRVYPGEKDSFLANRIAYAYTELLIKKCSMMITFHGGGDYLYIEPLVGYQSPDDEIGRESQRMAKVFGVEVLWELQRGKHFPGSLRPEMQKLGIPCITPEVGGQSIRHKERKEHVDICKRGILNVMKAYGMLSGEPILLDKTVSVMIKYMHAGIGGIFHLHHKTMEPICGGETIATISDLFGEVLDEIKAPFDGIIVGHWDYPVVQPGSWVFMFAEKI